MNMPADRTEFGFPRSACGCARCAVFCRYTPGVLVPADLGRLIPPDADPYSWAEEHLRAYAMVMRSLPDARFGMFGPLVPARGASDACHWFRGGKCGVHADAPFGCAFFDGCGQTADEARERNDRGDLAIADEWAGDTLYSRLWHHLWSRGLRELPTSANRAKMLEELARLGAGNGV